MVGIKVNIEFDATAGVLTHNVLFPPAIPSPTPMPSVEMLATQKWLGFFTGQNKFTTTVKHKGQCIVQDGHDQGLMILDITLPQPANIWYALMWPLSSRKITFGASTVKMNNTATGCAQCPIPPMMTCGDPISAPTAFILPFQLSNTVVVGMTGWDILKGILVIVASMAIDALFNGPGGLRGARAAFSDIASGATRAGRDAIQSEALDLASKPMATAAVSAGRQLTTAFLDKVFPMRNFGKFVASSVSGFTIGGSATVVGSGPVSLSAHSSGNPIQGNFFGAQL